MAMKWVAQMPEPVAMPAVRIQMTRQRGRAARARWNMLMAVKLAKKQRTTASRTRRQSCSTPRHVKARYMQNGFPPLRARVNADHRWSAGLTTEGKELAKIRADMCLSRIKISTRSWSRGEG